MRRWYRFLKTKPRPEEPPVERRLIRMILEGAYPPGAALPGERQLAGELGVARPALREALQRLARDGWLTIQHGKATRVNDIWRDGNLNVLTGVLDHNDSLPPGFVTHLLDVRATMAPAYARQAIARAPAEVVAYLETIQALADFPDAFAEADWGLHRCLTLASGNPIYALLLNGFAGSYERLACVYFRPQNTRASARRFYADLLAVARREDADAAEEITRQSMLRSIRLWQGVEAAVAPEATLD